jgi:hypothetical protein
VARSLCLYGATGSRKTTQAKWFSHYIAETTGKATLLLSMSDGGWSPMCDPEVAAGMIVPYKGDVSVTPLLMLRKMSQGYWPKYPDLMNAALAEMKQNPNGGVPPEASLVPINWDEIGGIAVEGWTSISSVIMRFLADQAISVGGENRLGVSKSGVSMSFNQAVVIDGVLTSEVFGSSTQGDYNFLKNTLSGFVSNWNSLPCHTVMYTALEAKTTEDGEKSGRPVYGPDIAGKKASAECGAWVGDLIHAQDYQFAEKKMVPNPSGEGEIEQTIMKTTVRFFYHKHPDADTGIMYPAKPRCAPEKIMELDRIMPGGYFEPEFGALWGVDRYLKVMDDLAGDASKNEALMNWRSRMDQKLGRGSSGSA